MKHIVFLSIILLLGAEQLMHGQDCSKLPQSFTSYAQASQLIKSSTFKMHESVNTSKSSWIRGADYFSCDGQKGFLIIKADDRDYIHQNVPIDTWNGFKKANSFGSYYSNFIKGNYRLTMKYQN
jgi:hypothetical protein